LLTLIIRYKTYVNQEFIPDKDYVY
jgi:hypothetical protein